MQYQVPQFIERETKILGPFNFKQFIFIGIAGAVIFMLYFVLAKANFLLFLIATLILIGGSLGLAFIKIGGRSLPETLGNSIVFFASSKIYLWQKRGVPPRLIKLEKQKPEKKDEEPTLRIKGKGRLEQLSTKIEIRAK